MTMSRFHGKGEEWDQNFSVCWHISQLMDRNVSIFFRNLNHTTFADIETKNYQLWTNECGMTHPNVILVKHSILNQNCKIRDFSRRTKQL